jgi:hypothetical protein
MKKMCDFFFIFFFDFFTEYITTTFPRGCEKTRKKYQVVFEKYVFFIKKREITRKKKVFFFQKNKSSFFQVFSENILKFLLRGSEAQAIGQNYWVAFEKFLKCVFFDFSWPSTTIHRPSPSSTIHHPLKQDGSRLRPRRLAHSGCTLGKGN